MYDSNTSQEPTASNRRGLNEAVEGDLKACPLAWQNASAAMVFRGVWTALPVEYALPSCTSKDAHNETHVETGNSSSAREMMSSFGLLMSSPGMKAHVTA